MGRGISYFASLAAALALAGAPVRGGAAAEPITIGLVGEMSGANAEMGAYQLNGIRLALDEINQAGGVLGRQLALRIEDSQSSNPGSVLALSTLAEAGNVAAVIGTIRSTQALAMLPTLLKVGIPMIIGGTDYTLTHANNPWLFRARPHDGDSAKAIADFGVNTLKRRHWVIIHTTETFGIGGKNRLTQALRAYGVTPVLSQGFRNNTQDGSFVAEAIKRSGADVLATYIYSPDNVAAFAQQLQKSRVNLSWVGSSSVGAMSSVRLGGSALHGSYAITDFVPEANPQARAFARKYQEKYGQEPDVYSSWAYDATHILALAIGRANSTRPDAIRRAILAIRAYAGVEGTYNYDSNGDALHGYNIVKNEGGKIVFLKHVDFTATTP
ncbi:MAG TPA: ABC transporter substrate-binding protein [Janthinobacterium sp.]|nr:ABC transporter substrate-binding protein [Janthinobacterium sp.]